MSYDYRLSVSQMKYIGLFDTIPYNYSLNDDDLIDVVVHEKMSFRTNWYKTDFIFTINVNISNDNLPLFIDKEFIIELNYNNTSHISLFMIDLYYDNINSDDSIITTNTCRLSDSDTE